MSDTIFVNAVTLTDADWFNDVNRLHYTIFGDPATAAVAARALQNKGADIASAGTLDLSSATGDFVHITGTTTITAITLSSGKEMTLVFDGILTLTYNATTLILPTSANITTAAGDTAVFRGDGSGNVRCISYVRRTGAPLTFGVTHANGGVVYSTASALAVSAVGSSGQILRSGGAGAPTWSTATYPSTAGTAGKILRSDGTNLTSTTATYPDTLQDGEFLYSDGANNVTGNTRFKEATNGTLTYQYDTSAGATSFKVTNTATAANSNAFIGTYTSDNSDYKDSWVGASINAASGGGIHRTIAIGMDASNTTHRWQIIAIDDTLENVAATGFAAPTTYAFIAARNDGSAMRPCFPTHTTTASAANAFIDTTSSHDELKRSTSSLRYKRDVESVDAYRIDAVMQLEPIWYRSKCPGDRQDWSWYGFGAEDVAKIDPRLVHWTTNENGELIPDGVQYERVSVLLLGVVKNQQKEIQSLKNEVAAIKAKLGM